MLTGSALSRFRGSLLSWFAQFQRDLPWRRTNDPYRVWLSEIMLQQTRVAAAIPFYERFLERFPDVKALAEAPEEEVLRLWAGLGYYSRARNLRKAARQIVVEHHSQFPADPEKALALPGVGRYTSAAILSIAHGKKLAVLDGNVARVLARLQAVRGELRKGGRWQALQTEADALLSPQAPGDWNQAMMELGATVCTPRSPQCHLCPVAKFCAARKQGLADIIPQKRSKRMPIKITLAALVLVNPRGQTLLLAPPEATANRKGTENMAALLSRMWHFPTIQVRQDAEKELLSFAQEVVFHGARFASELEPLARVRHAVTHRQITLLPFRAKIVKLPRVRNARLLPLSGLSGLPISNLTRKTARVASEAEK